MESASKIEYCMKLMHCVMSSDRRMNNHLFLK